MKRDIKTILLNKGAEDLNRLESFIESVCDEFNVYNDYYGNIVLSVVSLFEAIAQKNIDNQPVKMEFYNEEKGLSFEIYPNNNKLIRESQLVLEERESILDDNSFDWLFIIDHLADNLLINDESIILQFDIKSINAELASNRILALKSYLQGQTIFKESHLN